MSTPHSFCHVCGTRYALMAWPRSCGACRTQTWRNSVPVVVVLIPVGGGLLTVRRGIEPQKGHLALPGGFIDYGETWEEAAKREAQEETGLILPSLSFLAIETASNANILIFCQAAPTSIDLPSFQPNREVSELVVIDRPVDLAFSTHTKMARKFFDSFTPKD